MLDDIVYLRMAFPKSFERIDRYLVFPANRHDRRAVTQHLDDFGAILGQNPELRAKTFPSAELHAFGLA